MCPHVSPVRARNRPRRIIRRGGSGDSDAAARHSLRTRAASLLSLSITMRVMGGDKTSAGISATHSDSRIGLPSLEKPRRERLPTPLSMIWGCNRTVAAAKACIAVSNALTGLLGGFLGHLRW